MRGKKSPPLDLSPVPEGTPLTFDVLARAYFEDYVLQRYRTLNTEATHLSTPTWSSVLTFRLH